MGEFHYRTILQTQHKNRKEYCLLRYLGAVIMANMKRRKEMTSQQHFELLQKSAKHSNEYKNKPELSGADLSGADLSEATLVGTNLTRAILTQCSVYGISVWNVQLD